MTMIYSIPRTGIFFLIFASQANGFLSSLGGFARPGKFLEGKPASCEKEGAEAELPFQSPCIKCFCQGGLIACKYTTCPSLEDCEGIVVKKPGECCHECQETDICLYQNREYKDGDRWFGHKCTECSCNKGLVKCQHQVCNPNLTCPKGMKKGYSPGACCDSCIEETGMCTSFGDPHYQTFDKHMYNFQGKCKYVFTKDCSTNNFTIHVRNEGRHSRTFSWTKSVFLHFRGIEVALLQKLRVKVNGEQVSLPYFRFPDLYISENGYLMTVITSIGVEVVWDGDSYTEVHIPTSYRNKTCGFCGDFNGDATDDFTSPDGTLKANVNEFGESWQVRSKKKPACDSDSKPKTSIYPPCRGRNLLNARMKCSILKHSKFAGCHKYVNPRPFFQSCVNDMCQCPTSKEHTCICQSLTAYDRACSLRGKKVKWRSKKMCGIRCKGGAVYDDCGPACRVTCHKRNDANKVCLKPCVAGCQCPAGKVWHKRKCIAPSKCTKSRGKKKTYLH